MNYGGRHDCCFVSMDTVQALDEGESRIEEVIWKEEKWRRMFMAK